MHAMAVDQALHGLDVGRVAHLLGIFEVGLERPTENSAERVDLLAGEGQAVLELHAVGRREIGERRRLADGDRIALGLGAIVHGVQHRRGTGQGAGTHDGALLQEVAARRADHVWGYDRLLAHPQVSLDMVFGAGLT